VLRASKHGARQKGMGDRGKPQKLSKLLPRREDPLRKGKLSLAARGVSQAWDVARSRKKKEKKYKPIEPAAGNVPQEEKRFASEGRREREELSWPMIKEVGMAEVRGSGPQKHRLSPIRRGREDRRRPLPLTWEGKVTLSRQGAQKRDVLAMRQQDQGKFSTPPKFRQTERNANADYASTEISMKGPKRVHPWNRRKTCDRTKPCSFQGKATRH